MTGICIPTAGTANCEKRKRWWTSKAGSTTDSTRSFAFSATSVFATRFGLPVVTDIPRSAISSTVAWHRTPFSCSCFWARFESFPNIDFSSLIAARASLTRSAPQGQLLVTVDAVAPPRAVAPRRDDSEGQGLPVLDERDRAAGDAYTPALPPPAVRPSEHLEAERRVVE